VQVEPIKFTLKAPGSERLILKLDDLLSNFAFKFNLRRSSKGRLYHYIGDPASKSAGGVAKVRRCILTPN